MHCIFLRIAPNISVWNQNVILWWGNKKLWYYDITWEDQDYAYVAPGPLTYTSIMIEFDATFCADGLF